MKNNQKNRTSMKKPIKPKSANWLDDCPLLRDLIELEEAESEKLKETNLQNSLNKNKKS